MCVCMYSSMFIQKVRSRAESVCMNVCMYVSGRRDSPPCTQTPQRYSRPGHRIPGHRDSPPCISTLLTAGSPYTRTRKLTSVHMNSSTLLTAGSHSLPGHKNLKSDALNMPLDRRNCSGTEPRSPASTCPDNTDRTSPAGSNTFTKRI